MQRKHFLLTAFVCFSFINFSCCQENEAFPEEYKAPENIAFILLKLVDNTIKMEKYNNKEFNLSTNVIGKQKSTEHQIMSIDMAERGLSPRLIKWDEETTGKVDIIAGRTKNLTYSIDLENFFNESDNEVMAICFDCVVERRKDKETKEWKTIIDVVLPIKLDSTKIEFIFDEKIKAACGFFMGNEDFENLIAVSENITKKDALESGLLYLSAPKTEEATVNNPTQPETTPANSSSQKITFSYVLSKIKDGAIFLKDTCITKLIALKRIFGVALGAIFKKR